MQPFKNRKNQTRSLKRCITGFTLIEMLVVIIIVLIISAFSYTAVSNVLEGDRVRGGARSIESFLEGARNRAIHANQVRGVRFLLDDKIADLVSGDNVAVSSMIYIGAPDSFTQGVLQIAADDRTLSTIPTTPWTRLVTRELLLDGARIKIPNDTSGEWYTISYDSTVTAWKLNRTRTSGTTLTDLTYLLELQPGILPNQEPRVFPRGVLIDLDESKMPDDWTTSGSSPYAVNDYMDILFAPDGNMIGKTLSSGLVHFVVADQRDVIKNIPAGHASKEGDEFIVSIIPLTGNVGVYPIDPSDVYRFAEEGEVAK